MNIITPVLIIVYFCLLQTEAQNGGEDNSVLMPSENRGSIPKRAECGRPGTIGQRCINGRICRKQARGKSTCVGKKSLEIDNNLYCGEKKTIGRICRRGGICIRKGKTSFRCQKERPAGNGPNPSKHIYSKNQIDCDAMGIPSNCREPSFLFIGGHTMSDYEDPVTGEYSLIPGPAAVYPCPVSIFDQLPVDNVLSESVLNVGSAIYNGEIYACGGFNKLPKITSIWKECYKNVRGHWVKAPSMNKERAGLSLTLMGDGLIAAGGLNFEGVTPNENESIQPLQLVTTMEIFNGINWKYLPHTFPRSLGLGLGLGHCAVAISDTEILFIGGSQFYQPAITDGVSSSVVHYDINEGFTGRQFSQMKIGRRGFACAFYKGEVYVAGGYNSDFRHIVLDDTSHTVEILNLELKRWRDGPGLPVSTQWPTLHVMNDQLVLAADNRGQILTLNGNSWLKAGEIRSDQVKKFSNSVAFTCK